MKKSLRIVEDYPQSLYVLIAPLRAIRNLKICAIIVLKEAIIIEILDKDSKGDFYEANTGPRGIRSPPW